MRFTLSIYFLLIFCTSSVQASSFEIGADLYYFNYEEFGITSKSLDKELGFLPGIKVKYSFQYDAVTISPYLSLHDGTVDYIGSTQSGQPHNTRTRQNLLTFGFDLKIPLQSVITSNMKVGYKNWKWDRDILSKDGVLGLHEFYSWHELNIGFEHISIMKDKSFYTTQLSFLKILNPEMKIYLVNSSETLQLGKHPGLRIQIGKTWLKNTNSVNLTFLIEYWQFGRSNTVFTNDFFGSSTFITEPRSESIHTSFNLSYRF